MSHMQWHAPGEKYFESGLDHGCLYRVNQQGLYVSGVPWNGLITVTESPTGAESNKQYADDIVYLNLISAEEFGITIEAYQSPEEFDECDGTVSPVAGLGISQQTRRLFGFSYRSKIGNDIDGQDHGYKLNLVYGCLASPSERARTTINDSPEAVSLSWEVSTTPVPVPNLKPTSLISIDSTKADPAALKALEDILYDATDARLPMPAEVIQILSGGAPAPITPVAPTQSDDDTFRIVATVGYYYTADKTVMDESTTSIPASTRLSPGDFVISEDTIVTAVPEAGQTLEPSATKTWTFTYTP